MNRMIIGAIAATLAAGGGAAWWMTANPTSAVATSATQAVEGAGDGARLAAAPAAADEAVVTSAVDAPAAAVVAAGPAASALAPDDWISIERGYCFGPCPVYKATAYGDDRVVFEGKKFVVADGKRERKLDAGGFARLVDIARRHDIMSMDTNWPDDKGLNCPEPPTDLPTVLVAVDAAEIRRSVKFYEGCVGSPGADRVKALVADLDKALALDDWIGPRERFYGVRNKP
jgi:hypothetical protein